jgi:hypothetical protein
MNYKEFYCITRAIFNFRETSPRLYSVTHCVNCGAKASANLIVCDKCDAIYLSLPLNKRWLVKLAISTDDYPEFIKQAMLISLAEK